jgi:putative tryptophan/tyrosine transport system substrate-binding protein
MRRREFLGVLSGAAAWPLATHAQQTMPIIGWLSSRSAADSASALEHFQKGLAEAGYVEGRNVAVEYRWADGQFDRLLALAEDLVRRRVVVLVAVGGGQTPRAAQVATSTIPIVFGIGQDPVKAGLVANINRPGGNVTGATFFTALLGAKRLGLLRELVPGAETVALIANQNSEQGQRQILDVREAAQQLGQRLVILKGGSDAELEASFASLVQQRAGALLMARTSMTLENCASSSRP